MAPLLAGFKSAFDIDLGPTRITTHREVIQRYHESKTGRPLKTLMVGVLKASIDRKDSRSILVLESPGPASLILRDLFRKQVRILEDLMLPEGQDNTMGQHRQPTPRTKQCIINKDLWSQGASETHAGRIFVRVSKGTHIIPMDVSRSKPESPLLIIAPEVPVACNSPKSLSIGSLVMCYVTLLRVDIPVFRSSATEPIFSRGYGLHAVRIVHLFRSEEKSQNTQLPCARPQTGAAVGVEETRKDHGMAI
ncbi:hypothetical protein DFH06DRAFT_1129514 [Mycena polygramma]|nr:hypothetical protein DFH06DRAFT_1129514 [Mycena polygramma]